MTAAPAALLLPELGPPGWIALGLLGTYMLVKAYQSNATSNANSQAQSLSRSNATTACPTCKGNPCAVLANGVPGSKYRGGAHASTKLPYGDGLESHHMPSNAASPLPTDYGPAIQMDPADHAQTASQSRSPNYLGFIGQQRALATGGNFMGAFAMDVADVKAKFGSKYDDAIAQATAYAACLKRTGVVQ